MTKVIGFSEWHYGAEYAYESILSIAPYVDSYCIAYAARPGRNNAYACPDTEAELRAKAQRACDEAGTRLTWVSEYRYANRYAQRNVMFDYAAEQDADAIILTDADEVWQNESQQPFIDAVLSGETRFYRFQFWHFWRSFDWAMQYAGGHTRPLRGYNLKYAGRKGKPDTLVKDIPPMLHFGWAQHPKYWVYKMPSSGHYHRPEHYNWFRYTWLKWTPKHGSHKMLHPYGDDRFTPLERFDKATMPTSLQAHEYFNVDIIGGHELPVLPEYAGKGNGQ